MLAGSAGKLVLALVLGAAVGMERGLSTSSVGSRTCTLVALASAAFADLIVRQVPDAQWGVAIGAVATGVAFLGAGAIIKGAGGATGLGESGTIWCTAMIGLITGAGDIAIALLVAALVFAVNVLFRRVAAWIDRRRTPEKPEDDVLDG